MQFRSSRGFISGAGLIPRPDDHHRTGAEPSASTGTKLDTIVNERALSLVVFEPAVGDDPFKVVNLHVADSRSKRVSVGEAIDTVLCRGLKETKRKKNEQREKSAGHGSPLGSVNLS
jgi:hypothetical protein